VSYPNVNDRNHTTADFFSPTTIVSTTREKSEEAHTGANFDKRIEDTKHTDLISVLLVDDHMLMREGLRQLFALEKDIRVIGEAVDGIEALQKIRQLRPDVVLMDVYMPGMDGITVTQQVVQEFPEIAVIILSMQQQHQQVLQAVKSGAKGYLLKTTSVHDVAEAIRVVRSGGVFVVPEMTDMIVKEYRRLSEGVPGQRNIETLQTKEVEIVRYVAMGMSNKEISEKLAYSEKTVKNYLSTIFQKLHLRDRTQVAIFALRHGLLPEEDI
jgi:DNA-binding NarL/FixJ family response regulator